MSHVHGVGFLLIGEVFSFLPKLDKIIGHIDVVNTIAGGHNESLKEDGTIEGEIQFITGATSEVGFNKLTARTK